MLVEDRRGLRNRSWFSAKNGGPLPATWFAQAERRRFGPPRADMRRRTSGRCQTLPDTLRNFVKIPWTANPGIPEAIEQRGQEMEDAAIVGSVRCGVEKGVEGGVPSLFVRDQPLDCGSVPPLETHCARAKKSVKSAAYQFVTSGTGIKATF